MGNRIEIHKISGIDATERDLFEESDTSIRSDEKRGANRSVDVFSKIAAHVEHARNKHPDWYPSTEYVCAVAEMEWREFLFALEWEGEARAQEEALDLIAVLVRYIEGDAK